MIQLWGQQAVTEETGLGVLTCSYHIDTLTEFYAGTFDPPTDEDLSYLSENFGLRRCEKWWDGGYIAQIVFEGIVNPNIHQYGIYPTFKEAKLITHPNIQALMKKYNGTPNSRGDGIIWQYTLPTAGNSNGYPGGNGPFNLPTNPMYGQDSFVEVSAIYRSCQILTEMPDDVLSRLGKIKDKLPDDVKDVTPEGRNWLIMPSPCVKRGILFEDEQEWLLSPPGRPWNKDIYDFISV